MRSVLYIPLLVTIMMTWFVGCTSDQESEITCISLKKESFTIAIPAFGELKSTQATLIKVPVQLRSRQTIAWMAPENSKVKKGDVVVRLDNTDYQEKIKDEEYNISKLTFEIQKKAKEMEKKKSEFNGQQKVTELEKTMADNFEVTDETIFSRNEIIEAKNNKEYLNKKSRYYKKQQKKLAEQARTELQLLQLKIKGHQVRLQQYKEALKSMEIKAPHDGIFILEKNWRGEKPKVGGTIYRGSKLAKLPDLSRMEAKLFILESEAAGLKPGLQVTLTLDSLPARSFSGTIKRMDNMAKPIERNSPLKYFEAIASIEKTDTQIMKPGHQVKATIYVEQKDDVIAVPNQALFFEKDQAAVYVRNGSTFKKRQVTIGTRSLTRTIVESGLEEGEVVALDRPDQEHQNQ